jgi:hypothetical protein
MFFERLLKRHEAMAAAAAAAEQSKPDILDLDVAVTFE